MSLLAVLFERAFAADVLNSNDAITHLLERLAPVETVGFSDGARELRVRLEPVAQAA